MGSRPCTSAREDLLARLASLQTQRLVIAGGPRRGKSTLARELAADLGLVHRCGDPASKVKEPLPGVEYTPDVLNWSETSQFIADVWLTDDDVSWVIEGVALARALRKLLRSRGPAALDRVVVAYIVNAVPGVSVTPGQEGMAKGVASVMEEICDSLAFSLYAWAESGSLLYATYSEKPHG